jgi:hypothetical protein
MARVLYRSFVATSAVAGAAVFMLLAYTAAAPLRLDWSCFGRRFHLYAGNGVVFLNWLKPLPEGVPFEEMSVKVSSQLNIPAVASITVYRFDFVLGELGAAQTFPVSVRHHFISVSLPAMGALLALPAVASAARAAMNRRARWRRISRGCCHICGYDLRASRDKCPECGLRIATAHST